MNIYNLKRFIEIIGLYSPKKKREKLEEENWQIWLFSLSLRRRKLCYVHMLDRKGMKCGYLPIFFRGPIT